MSLKEESFFLHTINAPIFGVEEDLNEFITCFVKAGSPRFTSFAKLWQQKKLIHIIYGRQTQTGLSDILQCIYFHLVNHICQEGIGIMSKICALYLLYAFYEKQPIRKQTRISITPDIWKNFLQLSASLLSEEQWDVYYVFRHLCACSAFRFCASSQELYPGAPLYSRSDVMFPIGKSLISKADRRRLAELPKYIPDTVKSNLIPKYLLEVPEHLKRNWPAMDTLIREYVDAKKEMSKNNFPATSEEATTTSSSLANQSSEFNTEEMLLLGLNLVTYPDSLTNISTLLEEFTVKKRSSDEKTSRTKSEPEEGTNSSCPLICQRSAGHEEEKKPQQVEDDIGLRRKKLRHSVSWNASLRNLAGFAQDKETL